MKAIFAMDSEYGIGKNGTLPDFPNQKADLKWFKEMTMGKTVLMGKKTWADPKMPKPLPGRSSFVISTQDAPEVLPANTSFFKSPDRILPIMKDAIVIGGASILTQYIEAGLIEEMLITFHKGNYDCDTHINKELITQNYRLVNILHRNYFGQDLYINVMRKHEKLS